MAVSRKGFEKLLEQAKQLPKAQRLRMVKELSQEERASHLRLRKSGKVVKLGGLWAGYDFSEEEIAQARKEMWGNFGREAE